MSEKMKILQMIDTYYPMMDGVINVSQNYTRELNKIAVCDLATAKPERGAEYTEKDDFNVIRCSSSFAPDGYRNAHPALDAEFKKKIENGGYDIIHCHSPFNMGRYAVSVGKKLGIPVVLTLHTKYYDDFYRVTKSKFLSNIAIKHIIYPYCKADSVWTVSEGNRQTLRDYGYKGDIVVVRNGTEYSYPDNPDELIAEVDKRHNLKGKKNVFVFVGRMAMYKNLKLIADALKIVKDAGKDFTMLFVGGGFDLEEFKKYVDDRSLAQNCIFTDRITDRKLLQGYYLRSEMLIFPSTFDNASIAITEATAHKIPALVVKGSCCAEGIIDGENGFLCEENAQSLANVICGLCDKQDVLARAGENAYKTLYRSWADVAADVYGRYSEIIAEHKKHH